MFAGNVEGALNFVLLVSVDIKLSFLFPITFELPSWNKNTDFTFTIYVLFIKGKSHYSIFLDVLDFYADKSTRFHLSLVMCNADSLSDK